MAHFRAPYGSDGQHVPSPDQNFGYRYIVAFLVEGGNSADYIRRYCADAHAEDAPKDAVTRDLDGNWKRPGDIREVYRHRLDAYATALTKYEAELKADRAREQRST